MSALSLEVQRIKCSVCGFWNEVVAYECKRCKKSLVDPTSATWNESRQRVAVKIEQDVTADVRKAAFLRFVLGMAALILVVTSVGYGARYVADNIYIADIPRYEGEAYTVWLERLESEDVYMRRRAAEALDVMAITMKRPTVPEVMPALQQAARDPDEIVAYHAQSAIAILKKQWKE